MSLAGCQKDDSAFRDIEQNKKVNEQKIKEGTFTSSVMSGKQALEQEPVLKKPFSKFTVQKPNFTGKGLPSSNYDFAIDTASVRSLEAEYYTTYTFKTFRQDKPGDSLENYVFTVFDDGGYEQWLIRYPKLEGNENPDRNFDLDNISIKVIQDQSLMRGGMAEPMTPCWTTVIITVHHRCASGKHTADQGSECDFWLGEGSAFDTFTTADVLTPCPSKGPGGGGPGGGDGGGGGPGSPGSGGDPITGGGGGDSGGGGTPPNPDDGDNDQDPPDETDDCFTPDCGGVVVQPYDPEEPEEPETDIERLNSFLDNSKIENRIDEMAEDVNTSNSEQASEFRLQEDDSFSEYIVPESDLEVDGSQFPPVIESSLVRIHSHPLEINTNEAVAPVMSVKDIFGFAKFFKDKEVLGSENSEDVTSILVSKRGLYALRIENPEKVNEFLDGRNDISNGQTFIEFLKEQFQIEVINKTLDQCGNCPNSQREALFELNFTNFFKRLDSGISVFRAFKNNNGEYEWESL